MIPALQIACSMSKDPRCQPQLFPGSGAKEIDACSARGNSTSAKSAEKTSSLEISGV